MPASYGNGRARVVRDNRVAVIAKVRRIAAQETARAAEQTANLAQTRAPVRTGWLRGNIGAVYGFLPTAFRARVIAAASYSGYVERGTGRSRARAFLVPAFRIVAQRYLLRLRRGAARTSRGRR